MTPTVSPAALFCRAIAREVILSDGAVPSARARRLPVTMSPPSDGAANVVGRVGDLVIKRRVDVDDDA